MIEGAWIPCPDGCDDFACTEHGVHVADCPCPPIEAWAEAGLWPYGPSDEDNA
jgi:hypothetical protein